MPDGVGWMEPRDARDARAKERPEQVTRRRELAFGSEKDDGNSLSWYQASVEVLAVDVEAVGRSEPVWQSRI